jgi:hypothetical protein
VFSEQVASTHDFWINHPHTHLFSPHVSAKRALNFNRRNKAKLNNLTLTLSN